jgi:hypothetical protein
VYCIRLGKVECIVDQILDERIVVDRSHCCNFCFLKHIDLNESICWLTDEWEDSGYMSQLLELKIDVTRFRCFNFLYFHPAAFETHF